MAATGSAPTRGLHPLNSDHGSLVETRVFFVGHHPPIQTLDQQPYVKILSCWGNASLRREALQQLKGAQKLPSSQKILLKNKQTKK